MKKRISASVIIILALSCGIGIVSPLEAAVIFTDVASVGDENGNGWDNAIDLQGAITRAQDGDEIWVRKGTYKPDASDRSVSFVLKNGVKILGGFSGTETSEEQGKRDPEVNITILSGDIGTADDSSDNSTHVVSASSVDNTAVLDGFTITGGNAGSSSGGGMYSGASSPTVKDCVFTENAATEGAGMYNFSGNPTITGCTFSKNTASKNGGGMYNHSSKPRLVNCTFSENTAAWMAGGIYNYKVTVSSVIPTMANCDFIGNTAGDNGGGIYNSDTLLTMANCTFTGNIANKAGGMYNLNESDVKVVNCIFVGNAAIKYEGGGMYNYESDPTVVNCTFSGNTATYPDTGKAGGMISTHQSRPKIYNSIFWGNTADTEGTIYNDEDSSPTVAHCIVEGGHTGPGNKDVEPLFVRSPDPGDGDWTTVEDNDYGDVRLQWNSPAIDAGDNDQILEDTADADGDDNTAETVDIDLEGKTRRIEAPATSDTGTGSAPLVDMGAYEYHPPDPPTIIAFTPISGDIGASVTINGTNFIDVISVQFGETDAAEFRTDSDAQVTADVAEGTPTGKITMTTPGGTAESDDPFTYVPAPVITGFEPTSASMGSSVTITGEHFTGTTKVQFAGTDAESFVVNSETELIADVASGTITGKVTVTTAGGTAESDTELTMTDEPPTVANEMADQEVHNDGTGAEMDLSGVFTDPDNLDEAIQFVAESDNSEITPTVEGKILTLAYSKCDVTAILTITATSNEKTVTDTFTVTVSPMAGDLNCDGKVDLTDAILLLKILAGIEIADADIYNADAHGDEQLGTGDLIYILGEIE